MEPYNTEYCKKNTSRAVAACMTLRTIQTGSFENKYSSSESSYNVDEKLALIEEIGYFCIPVPELFDTFEDGFGKIPYSVKYVHVAQDEETGILPISDFSKIANNLGVKFSFEGSFASFENSNECLLTFYGNENAVLIPFGSSAVLSTPEGDFKVKFNGNKDAWMTKWYSTRFFTIEVHEKPSRENKFNGIYKIKLADNCRLTEYAALDHVGEPPIKETRSTSVDIESEYEKIKRQGYGDLFEMLKDISGESKNSAKTRYAESSIVNWCFVKCEIDQSKDYGIKKDSVSLYGYGNVVITNIGCWIPKNHKLVCRRKI